MMKLLFVTVMVLLALAPAATAKPGHGRKDPTIAIVSQTATTVTFSVMVEGLVENEAYLLWVRNTCVSADGVTVSEEFQPVVWDDPFNTFPATGVAGPFATDAGAGAVSCTAYAVKYPDVWTPWNSNTITYAPGVSG